MAHSYTAFLRLEPAQLLALVLGVPTIWIGGTFATSFAGWRQFARQFRASAEPEGVELVPVTGVIRWAVYRNLLRVRLAPEGLFVAPVLPILVGHPPLLFPWATIRRAETYGPKLFRKHRVTVASDDGTDRVFRLEDERIVAAVQRFAPGARSHQAV